MSRSMLQRLSGLLVSLGVLATTSTCRSRDGVLADVTLETDATTYVARGVGSAPRRHYAFTVVARLTNDRAEAIALERCYPDSPVPVFHVRAVPGGPSAGAYAPIYGCVGHEHPLVVPAHGSRIDTLHLTGPNEFGGTPPVKTGSPVGRLRLVYPIDRASGALPRGAEQFIQSNAFAVDTLSVPAGDA